MHEPDSLDDGLADFERRLACWRPAEDGLDRERMLFDAGVAAGKSDARSKLLFVPMGLALTALLALGCAVISMRIDLVRSEARLAAAQMLLEKGRYVERPDDNGNIASFATGERRLMLPSTNFLTLRNHWLERGTEFLLAAHGAAASNSTASDAASDSVPAVLRPFETRLMLER